MGVKGNGDKAPSWWRWGRGSRGEVGSGAASAAEVFGVGAMGLDEAALGGVLDHCVERWCAEVVEEVAGGADDKWGEKGGGGELEAVVHLMG